MVQTEKQAPACSAYGTSSRESHTDIKDAAGIIPGMPYRHQNCCPRQTMLSSTGDLVELDMGFPFPFQPNVRITFVAALNSLATTNYWNRLLPLYRNKTYENPCLG